MDPRREQPQEPQDPRTLQIPQRQFVSEQQEAAAHIVREQIDRIYDSTPPNQPAAQKPEPAAEQKIPEAYARTHQENFDWRQYHSAWQQYYQQYYQRYYWQHLHSERQKLAATAADQAVAKQKNVVVGIDPTAPKPTQTVVAALRSDITNKVKERAQKVRKSHHFIPLLSAFGVGLVFLFLQFNSVVIAQIQSYVSPGAISNDSITINPSVAVNVGPEAKLIIPKINVEVPVDYAVASVNEADIQNSLRDGATHYKLPGANAVPGQDGNAVILGHSSNDIFNQGEYKFVFVLLDRLHPGDVFYLHYNGTRYIYRVTESRVIDPTDIKALQIGADKPMATLITCTPPGTALKRLIIFGEQISPDPGGAAASAAPTEPSQNATIPGNGPTVLDQIWQFFF